MNYVALDQYTKDDIVKISDIPSIDGVVLGDLYCNKRMFEFSDHELINFARLAEEYIVCIRHLDILQNAILKE